MAYGDFEQFYYGGEIKLLAQSRAKCLALSAFFFFSELFLGARGLRKHKKSFVFWVYFFPSCDFA